MLLRSITEHVKAQNWTAVALDFAIVVVGVFVGIQVSNWNDAASDRISERQVLGALLEDFRATEIGFRNVLNVNEAGSESLKVLADLANGDKEVIPLQEIDSHIFRGLYQIPSYVPVTVTYDELRNSGRLDLIQSLILRQRLQGLASAIGNAADAMDEISSVTIRSVDPYLLRMYDYRGIVSRRIGDNAISVDWVDPTRNRRDTSEIIYDPLFVNLVLYRARMNEAYQRDAKRLMQQLSEIENLILEQLNPDRAEQ